MKGVLLFVVGIVLVMFLFGSVSAFPCGGEEYNAGYCCSDIYFDPNYVDNYANVCSQNFLYVDMNNPSCSDGISRLANSQSNPWCTLGRATWGSTNRGSPNPSEAAQAGDVVILNQGVYSDPGYDGREPLYNPVNSGSAGNYITFKGVGTVELTNTNPDYTCNSRMSPMIGSAGVSYIKWDGFTINQNNINYRCGNGIVQIWGDYTTISNSEIIGATTYYAMSDQHNAILVQGGGDHNREGIVIENNRLHGFLDEGGAHRNHVAITTYWMDSAIIRNNEIYDNGEGIYLKSTDEGSSEIRVYNNIIRDNRRSSMSLQSDSNWYIYQNIFKNNGGGFSFKPTCYQNTEGGCGTFFDKPYNYYIVNNVLDGNGRGIYFDCGDCSYMHDNYFQNNIITDSTDVFQGNGEDETGLLPQNVLFDYNLYYSFNRWFYMDMGSDPSQADWLGAMFNYQDPNSIINQNPLYVDPSTNNYRLQSGSSALNAGIDILDLNNNGLTTDSINMGAYITGDEVIGIIDYIAPSQPECSNSLDDDGDGQTDYPNDAGCTDANDNDESNCGDLVCEGGETCSSCVSDCPIGAGEICCSDIIYTGDCCLDVDCTAPETCASNVCTLSSGTIVSVDSTYGGYSMDIIDDEIINAYGGELTTWASGVSTTEPHWVQIDFSESRDINNVDIYWTYNNQQSMFMSSQEVQVQYWDGSQYLTAATITTAGEVEVSSVVFSTISTTSLRFWQPINMGPPTYSDIFWLTEIDYFSGTSACGSADTDLSGDINIGEIINYITRYKNLEINIGDVIAGITEYRYGC